MSHTKRRYDWFLPGMFLALALAAVFPQPGARGGWLYPEFTTKAGVALIFFLHGVALSFAAMRAGMLQWRVHLLIQSCVFLLFPLLGLGLIQFTPGWIPSDLRIGFFYLCATPSTVSSSIALTAAAHGNVPVAVFNATLSSLLGVVVTPLWMSLFVETDGATGSLGKVILDLCLWLVLPLVVGQLSRPVLAGWAARHKPLINTTDRLTILLLVYTSFCDSVQMGVWTDHGIAAVIATIVVTILLFWMMIFLTGAICDSLRFPREDRIAAVFCGSKKSLATGIPMAQLMFGSNPGLGLILLPLMVYHPLQLVICGVLASRWARQQHAEPPPLSELIEESEPGVAP